MSERKGVQQKMSETVRKVDEDEIREFLRGTAIHFTDSLVRDIKEQLKRADNDYSKSDVIRIAEEILEKNRVS
jgi:hypothetical protein